MSYHVDLRNMLNYKYIIDEHSKLKCCEAVDPLSADAVLNNTYTILKK